MSRPVDDPTDHRRATATDILDVLVARQQTVGVAESLTGGLLAAAFVEVPGASAAFRGGLVVYATDLKAALAGVPPDLLAERGPVDPAVAAALAQGVRQRCAADWGLATTGVAGPDRQGEYPVGTVFLGCAGPHRTTIRELALSGDRAQIRAGAVAAALTLLAAELGLVS